MIRTSKQADERFEAGAFECWCLHGAVGMAAGFRDFAKRLVERKTGARAVDLWRFLEFESRGIHLAHLERITSARPECVSQL